MKLLTGLLVAALLGLVLFVITLVLTLTKVLPATVYKAMFIVGGIITVVCGGVALFMYKAQL